MCNPGTGWGWRGGLERERGKKGLEHIQQDGRPACPPATSASLAPCTQGWEHLPGGCRLLISTMSSQRPAGKRQGSLQLASRNLSAALREVLENLSTELKAGCRWGWGRLHEEAVSECQVIPSQLREARHPFSSGEWSKIPGPPWHVSLLCPRAGDRLSFSSRKHICKAPRLPEQVPRFPSAEERGVAVTDCSRAVYKTLEDSSWSARQTPSGGPRSSTPAPRALGNPVCILSVETEGRRPSCGLK